MAKYDEVEFKRDVGRWPAGTRGTVLSPRGKSMAVKISGEEGERLALLLVPEKDLELVAQHLW